jgi:hypothetical protein
MKTTLKEPFKMESKDHQGRRTYTSLQLLPMNVDFYYLLAAGTETQGTCQEFYGIDILFSIFCWSHSTYFFSISIQGPYNKFFIALLCLPIEDLTFPASFGTLIQSYQNLCLPDCNFQEPT